MAAEAAENHPRILASTSRGSKREDDYKYLWFGSRDQDRMITYQQSFSDDMFLGFLHGDGDEGFPESYGSSDNDPSQNEEEFYEDEEDKDNYNNGGFGEKDKKFWENQQQLLLNTLRRTSSLETRIRNATKAALKELKISEMECGCGRPILVTACRNCLMREVSSRLRNDGFNSAVCKSKWRSSPDIPSGDHTFVDVVDNSSSKKGEVRVIIEINFRAEFEMARASEEYNRLVHLLPEVFVGKVERLHSVTKIMCSAAKKCMKEKKMHLAPWRRHQYMQAKWLGPCKRTTSSSGVLPVGESGSGNGSPRPRVGVRESMLTVDLLEMLPNMHCKAVAVV